MDDATRLVEAGEGLGPHGRLAARFCVALDEFISATAADDPTRIAATLVELGMTKTATMLGATNVEASAGALWREGSGTLAMMAGFGPRVSLQSPDAK